MRRIQLADHVEKSVLYVIERYEEDLSAEADGVDDFLMALAQHEHPPICVENIVISDRNGAHSYGEEILDERHPDIKKRWKKTLDNRVLFGTNVGLVERRSELDALSSRGLVDRTYHTFDAYDGHGFFSLISPTPLGVEFVCACRGESMPCPSAEENSPPPKKKTSARKRKKEPAGK
jgi:hypothetical protein